MANHNGRANPPLDASDENNRAAVAAKLLVIVAWIKALPEACEAIYTNKAPAWFVVGSGAIKILIEAIPSYVWLHLAYPRRDLRRCCPSLPPPRLRPPRLRIPLPRAHRLLRRRLRISLRRLVAASPSPCRDPPVAASPLPPPRLLRRRPRIPPPRRLLIACPSRCRDVTSPPPLTASATPRHRLPLPLPRRHVAASPYRRRAFLGAACASRRRDASSPPPIPPPRLRVAACTPRRSDPLAAAFASHRRDPLVAACTSRRRDVASPLAHPAATTCSSPPAHPAVATYRRRLHLLPPRPTVAACVSHRRDLLVAARASRRRDLLVAARASHRRDLLVVARASRRCDLLVPACASRHRDLFVAACQSPPLPAAVVVRHRPRIPLLLLPHYPAAISAAATTPPAARDFRYRDPPIASCASRRSARLPTLEIAATPELQAAADTTFLHNRREYLIRKAEHEVALHHHEFATAERATRLALLNEYTTAMADYLPKSIAWATADNRACTILLSALPNTLMHRFQAREMHTSLIWAKLQAMFECRDISSIGALFQYFSITLATCDSTVDYVGRMQEVADRLAARQAALPEPLQIHHLLYNLTPDYESRLHTFTEANLMAGLDDVVHSLNATQPRNEGDRSNSSGGRSAGGGGGGGRGGGGGGGGGRGRGGRGGGGGGAGSTPAGGSSGAGGAVTRGGRPGTLPPCTYVSRHGPHAGTLCGQTNHPPTTCFKALDDAWFDRGNTGTPPRWNIVTPRPSLVDVQTLPSFLPAHLRLCPRHFG
ncbi:unnamed protein product [Closterium sp. NIES-65]|nr:unnamed protein product [Closterium sp. NIES-65]